MNPRYLDGPDEPQEWPCQNCTDGFVPHSTFAPKAMGLCEECDGRGTVDIDPADFIDPDYDPTLEWDDVDHDYGRMHG